MKSTTIITKLINQIDLYAENMKQLLRELDESIDNEKIKLKEEVAKKIASSFDLDIELIKKKIIKKKKKTNQDSESDYAEIIEDSENNIIIPIYTKIIYQDKEYFYDDKPHGMVLEKEGLQTKIVGYMNSDKTINFI